MTIRLGTATIDTEALPGALAFKSTGYHENRRVPRATDYNDRTAPIGGLLFHTVHGKRGPLKPGSVPDDRDIAFAQYQARTERNVSWDFTVGRDGDVVQSNDPTVRYTWHAGAREVNAATLGVEAVQDDDGAQYEATIRAEVALAELLCERLHIPRITPVNHDGTPFTGLLRDRVFPGVYGHRNLWTVNKAGKRTAMKPYGDPDDHLFRALLAAGFRGAVIKVVDGLGAVTGELWTPPGAPDLNALPEPWMTPPPWVDLSRRIPTPPDHGVTTQDALVAFVRGHLDVLTGTFRLPADKAYGLVAHAAVECGWGVAEVGSNAGGVKLRQSDNATYAAKHGHGLAWWAKRGHVAAGDAAWVFYRAFDSREDFWAFWLKRYVPRPSLEVVAAARDPWAYTPEADVVTADYAATGAAFHTLPRVDGGEWLAEMILAGYRGPVRAAEMRAAVDRGSVPHHASIAAYQGVLANVRRLAGIPR